MTLRFMFVMTVGLLLAADRSQNGATKKDGNELDGTWQVETFLDAGQRIASDETKKMNMVIKGESYAMKLEGDPIQKGTIRIDPAESPKTMDTTARDSQGQDRTTEGIYELDGDTLKVCIAPPGSRRPTEFASTAANKLSLFVLKRQNP